MEGESGQSLSAQKHRVVPKSWPAGMRDRRASRERLGPPGVEARWVSSAVGVDVIITMGRGGHGRRLFQLWSSFLLPRGLVGAKAADQACGCSTTATTSPRSTAKGETSTIVASPSGAELAAASEKNLVWSGPTYTRSPTIS